MFGEQVRVGDLWSKACSLPALPFVTFHIGKTSFSFTEDTVADPYYGKERPLYRWQIVIQVA